MDTSKYTILTETSSGLDKYFLIENGSKIDGPFWFVSHLLKRAKEYGVEITK
jgi:hypothetical protein